MTYLKTIALSSVAMVGLASATVSASEFHAHHSIGEKVHPSDVMKLSAEEKIKMREYMNYEQREPCQFYQPIPEGFMKDGCHLKPIPPKKIVRAKVPVSPSNMPIGNVVNDYEVHFAFDSALIEPAAGEVLDQVAKEIKHYKPNEVTVSGYTDKAGPAEYNNRLSKERAQAISHALSDRGVPNRIFDEKAYGEYQPAIDTEDGVALKENRRVVVEFHK